MTKLNFDGHVSEGGTILLHVSGFRTFTSGYSDFCQNQVNLQPQPNGGFTPRIQSGSANDDTGGPGWDAVRFFGWDTDGNWKTAGWAVGLDGTNFSAFPEEVGCLFWPATTPQLMGITASNFGDIIVDDGSSNTLAGADQTSNAFQACTFKVPVAHTAVVKDIIVTGGTGSGDVPIRWKIEIQEQGLNEWAVLAQGVSGQRVPIPHKVLDANSNIRATGLDLGGAGGVSSATMYIELHRPRT